MQSRQIPSNTKVIIGVVSPISLLIEIDVLARLSFAFSNFFCSRFWLLNALMTRRPVRFSRVISVILSINFWKILNFLIANERIRMAEMTMMPIASAIIHVMSSAVANAWIRATTAIIGARRSIERIIVVVC